MESETQIQTPLIEKLQDSRTMVAGTLIVYCILKKSILKNSMGYIIGMMKTMIVLIVP